MILPFSVVYSFYLVMFKTSRFSMKVFDFDDINLNYFLLASELPSYNYKPNYSYPITNLPFNDYNAYALNTLGYLETQVRLVSNNKFNTIRPTIIDGEPHYEFINREDYQRILPRSGLYQPIVLSQTKYNRGIPALGHLIIAVRCIDYSNTIGVNAYDMDSIEYKAGYKAKVPINDNGFEYPISFISIDVVQGNGYYIQNFIINESYYKIDQGNLYFAKSLEEIISEQYPEFNTALKSGRLQSLIYYTVHVYFDVFVPDTTEETHSLALTQATQHVVMDYFNQYMYAQVTANMISEIAYTETLTFWSTLITSVAMYAGHWIVGGGTLQSFAMAGVQAVKSSIFEVFDEIIKDAFIEAIIENTVDMWGWSEDAALWLSALGTSVRETFGAFGQFVLGFSTKIDLQTNIALFQDAVKAGDMNAQAKIAQRIKQAYQQQQEQKQQDQKQRSTWAKLLKSGFFKGILMIMPTVLFDSFSFLTLKGLTTIGKGSIDLALESFTEFNTKVNAFKKGMMEKLSGKNSRFKWKGLKAYLKRPSDLDAKKVDVNNEFEDSRGPPLVDVLTSINSQRNTLEVTSQHNLDRKFNEIRNSEWSSKFSQGKQLAPQQESFEGAQSNHKSLDRMEKWSEATKKDIESTGEFEEYHPKREMTIKEMLTEANLYGNDRIGVLVNGKKVESDSFVIRPEDGVMILPILRGNAPNANPHINSITNKINGIMNSGKLSKTWQYLTAEERVDMLKFYDSLTNGLYDKSSDFDPRKNSPYLPHLKFMVDELTYLLNDLGIITSPTYLKLEGLISPHSNTRISSLIPQYRPMPSRDAQFAPREDTLDKWLIYTENKINDLFSSQIFVRDSALYLVRSFFDSFYSLFGFQSKSPFYREAKLLPLRIGDVLTKAKVPGFKTNTYRELGAFIDREVDGIYTAKREEPSSIPKIQAINKLLEDIQNSLKLKTSISDAEISQIMEDAEVAASIYIQDIQRFLTSQDMLEDMPDLPNRRLIEEIIHNPYSHALERIQFKGDLNKLLFGDAASYSALGIFFNSKASRLSSLFTIQFNVERWTIKDFDNDNLRIKISDSELRDLKLYTNTVIERWIFNNPYTQYIAEAPVRFGVKHSKEFLRREFNVAYKTFRAFAVHENNPGISFKKIKQIATAQALDKYLFSSPNRNIGADTAKAYLKILEDFKKNTKDANEIAIYEDAVISIKEYVRDRHLGFQDKYAVGGNNYNPIFQEHWYKSTLIIVDLLRFAGRNPFTFIPLKPELFDGNVNTGLYQSHHLDAANKQLLQFIGIVLLDPVWHGRFNYISRTSKGIVLQERLRDSMIELMDKKTSITENDIRTVFGDLTIFGTKVSDMWINNPDFNTLLADWNDDRQLIQQGKFLQFLRKRFSLSDGSNPVLERYWFQAKETIDSFLLLMDDYDFSYLFTDADIDLLKRYFKI